MKSKKGGNMSVYIYTDAGPFKYRKRKKKYKMRLMHGFQQQQHEQKYEFFFFFFRFDTIDFVFFLYPPFLISFFCDENIVEKRRKPYVMFTYTMGALYGILLQEHNRISAQSIECILPISASFFL